jgi:hypothetical protein
MLKKSASLPPFLGHPVVFPKWIGVKTHLIRSASAVVKGFANKKPESAE